MGGALTAVVVGALFFVFRRSCAVAVRSPNRNVLTRLDLYLLRHVVTGDSSGTIGRTDPTNSLPTTVL